MARRVGLAGLILLGAAGALSLSVAACGGPDGEKGARKKTAVESLMYVVNAGSGTLAPAGDKRRYTLTLRGIGHHVTAFSDRPARITYNEPTERFASQWDGIFGSDPPNAALDFVQGGREADAVVLELKSPRLRGSTITFDARRLQAATDGVAHYQHRLDSTPPRQFADASLFIDYGAQDVYLTDYVYLDSEERDR